MKISFVIPAQNEEAYVGDCIDSIKTSLPLDTSEYEIIVVNNDSSDHTKSVAEAHGAYVVDEKIHGTSRARESGAERAHGEWVAFVDADCRLHKKWYDTFLKLKMKNENAVSFSGPYRYYDGNIFKKYLLYALWWLSAPLMYRFVGYMILGGNFVVKKEALQKVGGFNTSITFYGDDTDAARKLSAVGKVVFSMGFFTLSSMRRFNKHGIFKTNFLYILNFIWPVIFKKPFSNS